MKNTRWMRLIVAFVLTILVIPCVNLRVDAADDRSKALPSLENEKMIVANIDNGSVNEKTETDPITGLIFELVSDGNAYRVVGVREGFLLDMVIPESFNGFPVIEIADHTFLYTEIRSVVIPNSIISMGHGVFEGCSSLASVVFAEGSRLESMGLYVFDFCESLETITLPASLTGISRTVFECCFGLKDIFVEEGSSFLVSVDGILYNKDMTTLIKCGEAKEITEFTIPDGVLEIGECAFSGCADLTSITVPNSLKSFGWCAFSRCDKLKTVYYSGTSSQWENIYDHGNPVFKSATVVLIGEAETDIYSAPETCTMVFEFVETEMGQGGYPAVSPEPEITTAPETEIEFEVTGAELEEGADYPKEPVEVEIVTEEAEETVFEEPSWSLTEKKTANQYKRVTGRVIKSENVLEDKVNVEIETKTETEETETKGPNETEKKPKAEIETSTKAGVQAEGSGGCLGSVGGGVLAVIVPAAFVFVRRKKNEADE